VAKFVDFNGLLISGASTDYPVGHTAVGMDLRIEVCEPISATLSSNPPICLAFANTD